MFTETAKRIIITIFLITIGLSFLSVLAVFNYRSYELQPVTIIKGEGLKEIAANLQKKRIINSSLFFTIYVVVTGSAKSIKAGQYEFNGTEGIPGIIDIITEGRVTEKEITIIEGWNLADIGEYLENQNINSAEDFFRLAGKPLYLNKSATQNNCRELIGVGASDFSDKYSFLIDKPASVSLEGYLYPDTYRLPFDADTEAVIKIMLDNFDRKLTPELRAEISRQNKSIANIITMASLLEKEVKSISEKKIVSGILWKRLSIGMPLQVDSTVLYSIGPQSQVSYVDTATCSPYNTYRFRDLPVGPISNPGIDSITAAIYPEESDYLYYLSTKEGQTLFSKTLEEHNVKKEKYLK